MPFHIENRTMMATMKAFLSGTYVITLFPNGVGKCLVEHLGAMQLTVGRLLSFPAVPCFSKQFL